MNRWVLGAVGLVVLGAGVVAYNQYGPNGGSLAAAGGAFDQYGYNDKARIFNGTGASWCEAKNLPADCMGIYSPDKLVMKWTADWDRGNAEGWSKPPYTGAWTDNEWNGKGVTDGSGAVWHYKIIWVGSDLQSSQYWRDGGYPIWGQFEVVMDQGQDLSMGPGHIWFAKATPNGYGSKK
ncbi:MAG: hypothetical protein AAB804_00570 [Patescibacteria group bacterium]